MSICSNMRGERGSPSGEESLFPYSSLDGGRIFPRSSPGDILKTSLTREFSHGPFLCHITTRTMSYGHPRNVQYVRLSPQDCAPWSSICHIDTQALHHMVTPKRCHTTMSEVCHCHRFCHIGTPEICPMISHCCCRTLSLSTPQLCHNAIP